MANIAKYNHHDKNGKKLRYIHFNLENHTKLFLHLKANE